MQRIYFDNAATTPLDEQVLTVMTAAMRHQFGNPSSIYAEGRQARAAIEQARKTVAEQFSASIGEIFFTSGGTEANNMALKCAVRDLGVERIISSPIEHHCILHTLESLRKYQGARIEWVKLLPTGAVDLSHLRALLAQEQGKTLVSLMHGNNEIGTLLDLDAAANLCSEYGAYFHSDTVQTVGYFPINVAETPVSFLSGSAHKFHGPKGVGFIYINSDNLIQPFLDGGAQERNMRAGTENVYGILGLAKAIDLAYTEREEREQQIRTVRDHLWAELKTHFPDVQLNGDLENGHYKVLSVSFPASPKADLLLFNLDIAGISVSGGSACSSGADAGSHVIGHFYPDSPRKTIRFSFSHHNTRAEADQLIAKLRSILSV